MKTPIKPFVVEVKRSRMSVAIPSNARSEPIPRVDIALPSVKAEVSPARKAAEQMFNALLASPSSSEKPIVMRERAFETTTAVAGQEASPSPEIVGADQIDAPMADAGNGEKRPAGRAVGQPASRKVAGSGKTSTTKKVVSVPLFLEAAVEASVPPAHLPQVEETAVSSSQGMTEAPPKGGRRDWKPGERWKRRLRHQR